MCVTSEMIIKEFPKFFFLFFSLCFPLCNLQFATTCVWFTTQRKIKSSKWASLGVTKTTKFSPLLRYSVAIWIFFFPSLSLFFVFRCYFYFSSYVVVVVVRENFPVFNEFIFYSSLTIFDISTAHISEFLIFFSIMLW